jgi:sortase (surface protein transpeptidase)
MEIPEDVATVGWYELGVAPGEDGSAVIAGHVDSRTQGRGAFYDIGQLDVGDEATVTHDDGATSDWRVTGRTTYPKDEAPLAELFRRGGDPQLVLITCGGEFDAGARSVHRQRRRHPRARLTPAGGAAAVQLRRPQA